jgi:hypothetical protein
MWSYLGLLVGFVIAYALTSPEDDDDGGPDKGIMQPVYQGSK